MTVTPKEFMTSLDAALQSEPSRTAGLEGIFAFDVSGDAGGSWWIESNDGSGAVHEGSTDDAVLTVRMTDEVLVKMATGELDGAAAYFDGLLTIEGEQSKAMYLGQLFGQ